MNTNSLLKRITRFIVATGLTLSFIYIFLPLLTSSCSTLQRMSDCLQETGIDPSRYYYTDVEQVQEGELYLRDVLEK
ncbi:MAG: hypothetical protein GX055_05335 [Desulfovibrionales bacterium]|nr:hypothetical protein [Desulfovibrionales bacterium]